MIFLMGGNGFVGSGMARLLARLGRQHVIITRDNYADWVGRECDLFINANGNSKKMLAQREPLWEFDASVRSVRASLVDFRYRKYVYLSSCDVYPDCSTPATTDEAQLIDPASQSPYGFHKLLAEQCVRHAARQWQVFRLGGFVGPALKKNAIFDILQGGPLWLDPASRLQFLHTDDAAEIILQLADSPLAGETWNLCGRGTIELSEVIQAVGGSCLVQPDAPRVQYEIGLAKISQHVELPSTHDTALNFVAEQLAARQADHSTSRGAA